MSFKTAAAFAACALSSATTFADPSLDAEPARASTPMDARAARAVVSRLPLAFEVNRGQAPTGWDFLVRCRGYHAFVSSQAVVFSFDGARLTMSLAGAERVEPRTRGLELPGKANYFLGDDPAKWISDVPLTRGARYADVAANTAWSFGGDGRALEFAFDLAPGAPAPRLTFDGAKSIRVADNGSLRLAMPRGVATIGAPVAWQDADGRRLDAKARWVLDAAGVARIETSPRDANRPVHVDPTVAYETYFGTTLDGYTGGAAMDAAGAAYLCGSTQSTSFPTTSGAFDVANTADASGNVPGDGFVTKIDPTGSWLVYSTYVGGSGAESMHAIAVDASGAAYVTGLTYYNDYPTTGGAYLTTGPGQAAYQKGVLTKLDSTGSALVWSTYLAFPSSTNGYREMLALTPTGGVYVVEGASLALISAGGGSRVFLTPVDPSSASGGQTTQIYGLAADSAGDAYVTGWTTKTNFATTSGAYQRTLAGGADGFVKKVSSTGSVVYATLCGGTGWDSPCAVDVNWSGQAFVAGNTSSSNYPVTSGAYLTTRSSFFQDGYLTRFNETGAALKYSTFLGGPCAVNQVRVHPTGACVVVGLAGTPFPTTSNGFQPVFGGPWELPEDSSESATDDFVIKFNLDNSLAWSSWCGGSGSEGWPGLGMGPDGSVVVAAATGGTTDLPLVSPYQSASADLFLVKIPDTLPTTLTSPSIGAIAIDWTVGRPFSRTFVPSGGMAPITFGVGSGALPPGLTLSAAGVLSGTPTQAGTFTAVVHVSDLIEKTSDDAITFRVNAVPSLSTTPLPGWTIGAYFDQAVPAAGGTPPLVFQLTGGATPTGMVLASNGRLLGTPTTVGAAQMTVKVTDAAGATDTKTLTFGVHAAPSVNAAVLPPCTTGLPYVFQFGTSAGTPPFAWSVVQGPIPATGIGSDGGLYGIAGLPGNYAFKLRATDAAGVSAERSFTATVNAAPQITTTTLPLAAEGRPYAAALAGTGGTPPLRWDFTSGAPPAGVLLDTLTGALSGTVKAGTSGAVVFRLTDACGAVATREFGVEAAGAVNLTGRSSSETLDFGGGLSASVTRFLELTAGSKLDVVLAGAGTRGAAGTIALADAAGSPIDVSSWLKFSPKSMAVKGFVVPATGRYFLRATATGAGGRPVTLKIAVAPAASFVSHAVVDGAATAEGRFSAPPGALVSITAKATKGSAALPRIVSVVGPDGADIVPGGKTVEKGKAATFTSKMPLAGGDWRVVVAARDGTAGDVAWTVKLKLPKTYDFALPEVPAGE